MPQRSKGPRLYERPPRRDQSGKITHAGVWVIRDGPITVSTGCGPDDKLGAERALTSYLAKKFSEVKGQPRGPGEAIYIAEVLSLYGSEAAPKKEGDRRILSARIDKLMEWWGDKAVSEVRRTTCRDYVAWRTKQRIRHAKTSTRTVSQPTARRELVVLSAAINYWHAEHPLPALPVVWLPEDSKPRQAFLDRGQAAKLLAAAIGFYRDKAGAIHRRGKSARANRSHIARFILIGLYTGTRHSAMTGLTWETSADSGWVDLERGVMHRRGAGESETKKRRPPVRLQQRLLAHLRRWDRIDRATPLNDGSMITHVIHHGGAAIASKVRTGWEGVREDAGLGPEIVPHVLRHTCGTWLAQRGVEVWEAAGYLGMTAAMFERVYGHHHPDFQSAASKALSGPWRR
ncbi:MAG: tyrosine-type recombinase/integrase [Chelatococcus sp.]|nr:tyrosine-type recombinase/integrase [Chelatococcus sp.]CAH1678384.1 Site-specific integrase [Hyphomicrobiales bacterium]